MKLATNPAVWRVALAAIIAALVQLGLLTPAIGDQLNGTVTALAASATILLPVAAAWWSKRATAPVAAGTPAAKYLTRGPDGVYTALNARRVDQVVGGQTDAPPASEFRSTSTGQGWDAFEKDARQ